MWKICAIFGGSFFRINIGDILNFQWIKYLGKDVSYLKNWGIGMNYCWNYGLSKLLLHFIEYSLDQLNNEHTRVAVNSTIQYFEGRSKSKHLLKVWLFLVYPPQNGDIWCLMSDVWCPMSDVREVWKYRPLKDFDFVQFRKNFTGSPFCGGWTRELQTFSRHFFWERPSKYCIVEITATLVCSLLSWSRLYSMKWSSNFDSPYRIFSNLVRPKK